MRLDADKSRRLTLILAIFSTVLTGISAFAKPQSHPPVLTESDFQIRTESGLQAPLRQTPGAQKAISAPPSAGPTKGDFPAPLTEPGAVVPKSMPSPEAPAPFETSFASWPARGRAPIAAILSIHGFGLHKESFAGFANQMAGRGISTYAIDVRGFGSWMSERGEDKRLDFYQTMMDLRSSIYWVKTMNPGVPVFLLGESMGGAIALQATALFPECVSGLIASGPGSQYYGGKKAAMEVALRMVRPNAKFNVADKVVAKATTDSDLRNDWLHDPRAKLEMTPKQMAQFAAFMNQSAEMAKKIDSVPVLMLQGGRDKLSKADGTLRLFNDLKTPYKKYVLLDDCEHLIFEKGRYDARTADIVETWLTGQTQRLKSAGSQAGDRGL